MTKIYTIESIQTYNSRRPQSAVGTARAVPLPVPYSYTVAPAVELHARSLDTVKSFELAFHIETGGHYMSGVSGCVQVDSEDTCKPILQARNTSLRNTHAVQQTTEQNNVFVCL